MTTEFLAFTNLAKSWLSLEGFLTVNLTAFPLIAVSSSAEVTFEIEREAAWFFQESHLPARILLTRTRGIAVVARDNTSGDNLAVLDMAYFGRGKKAAVSRAMAGVEKIKASTGLWVVFCDTQCPVGLVPSSDPAECFLSYATTTWGGLAYAVGSGLPTLVYFAKHVTVPNWNFHEHHERARWFIANGNG